MFTLKHATHGAGLASAAALLSALALAGPAAATTAPAPLHAPASAPTTVAPTTQGIIMRDGGICDPIRHMGC
jgi:hypothetical protein